MVAFFWAAPSPRKIMPNPWDIPPRPRFGDESADRIYEAVGGALCTWEEIELRLSWIYSVLTNRAPPSHTIIQEYGRALNFNERVGNLEKSAAAYFIKSPDQALEGEVSELFCEVRQFSLRRNEIAHGVIRAQGRTDYFLFPPSYAARRWRSEHAPTFVYNAANIHNFHHYFIELLIRVDATYRVLRRRLPS